jgi:hypothetical protein
VSKVVGHDRLPSFVTKSSSEVLAFLLRNIFYLGLSKGISLFCVKKAALCLFSMKTAALID